MASVDTCNEELVTVRDAMRTLNQLLDRLDAGELEKIVLWQGGRRMRAVILPVETYAKLVDFERTPG